MGAPTYDFDANQTGGTRFLDQNGDTVVSLRDNVFPPVGTTVWLPNGSEAEVTGLTLDLSNDSEIAQVFVGIKTSTAPES